MRILIFGASKTGTTALTYAIQKQLPEHEIVFEPPHLKNLDYSQPNLIVKSLKVNQWHKYQEYTSLFDKKMLIVRHPFDRLISQLLYTPFGMIGFSDDSIAAKYIDILKRKTLSPKSINTQEIINVLESIRGNKSSQINQMRQTYKSILEMSNSGEFEIIKYENFVDGNTQELDRYLGVTLETETKVAAEFKRVVRTKKHGDWKNWLNQEDLDSLSPIFAEFNQQFDYEATLDENIVPTINENHSYLYTINVINDYRKRHHLPLYIDGKLTLKNEGIMLDEAIDYIKKKELIQAEESVNSAIKINPKIPGIYLLLSKILIKANKSSEAVAALARAIELNPELLVAYRMLKNVVNSRIAEISK